MSKDPENVALRTWLEGHELANTRRREELATMTTQDKLRQISRLMVSASLFDMSRRAEGDTAMREIWQTLRTRLHDR